MTSTSPTISAGALDEPSFLPTERQFFGFILLYFALLLVFRTLISETAGIDEADQLVVGQKLSWGYGPHAPLYTWLMILFLRVFGPSEFSLTLLRELLLFGIYVLTYFNTRLLTRSHAAGVVAALALQFHPSIVWESQRELTHSIVASLMILATLLAFFRLRPDRWGAWLVLGLFGGLSVLSKYNAALFYAAMLISALSLPNLRCLVLHPRMAVVLAVSLLVVSPNLLWVMSHRDLALGLVYKFGIHESMPWAEAVGKGLRNWFLALIAHVTPLVLVLLAVFGRTIFIHPSGANQDRSAPGWLRPDAAISDHERFPWRTFLIVCIMVVLSVLLLKVTEFKDRWLQPIFVCLPILLVAILRNRLDRTRRKTVLALGLFVTVAIAMMAFGRLFFTEQRGRRDVLNVPFREFAASLKVPAESSDFILASDYWLADNLRLWFPDKRVFSPELAPPNPLTGNRCLIVWDASKRPGPPAELVRFAQTFRPNEPEPTPLYLEEVWKYHRAKTMKLGVWALQRS